MYGVLQNDFFGVVVRILKIVITTNSDYVHRSII